MKSLNLYVLRVTCNASETEIDIQSNQVEDEVESNNFQEYWCTPSDPTDLATAKTVQYDHICTLLCDLRITTSSHSVQTSASQNWDSNVLDRLEDTIHSLNKSR